MSEAVLTLAGSPGSGSAALASGLAPSRRGRLRGVALRFPRALAGSCASASASQAAWWIA